MHESIIWKRVSQEPLIAFLHILTSLVQFRDSEIAVCASNSIVFIIQRIELSCNIVTSNARLVEYRCLLYQTLSTCYCIRYYKNKYRRVNAPHVVMHYAAGARLIGLTEKQLARHLERLQASNQGMHIDG